MEKTKPKLIVILGQTASGKSSLAIKLAKKFDGEIVSADSRQIYRGMDIGTAKLLNHESIPHHLIDIVNPDEEFTLAEYKKIAVRKINEILERGKIPFLVGGTGLYVKAVVDNFGIPKVASNKALRKKLEKKPTQELFEDLKRFDPKTAESIDSKNKRRLIRALEVKIFSGVSFVSAKKIADPYFNTLQIGIKISREKLYKNIDQRVEEQIEMGLESEVKSIFEELSEKIEKEKIWSLPSMSGICYQEFKEYFEAKTGLEKVIQKIKLHNRQYARRQMTWFKRDKRIHWIEKPETAEKLISEFLS
ncbi:tRNA (adenosine(37)-N6)-dimethylallyltransferase MiaA [Patescibacteria group bacterium]|nr:tRNA (adenosine(37)-N6)-dimethylallyltransferase MiaA [Patescibacteria group bacterium]